MEKVQTKLLHRCLVEIEILVPGGTRIRPLLTAYNCQLILKGAALKSKIVVTLERCWCS